MNAAARILSVSLWASLAALPASAATISLTGGFTNFYTPFAYGTNEGVVNYLNGQQLCPVLDCRLNGEAYRDFATPVTSISYKMVVDGQTWTENLVSFAPAQNQTVNGFGPSNKFLFGRLTYANGIWSDPMVRLSFNLTASSPDAMLLGYDFEVSDVLVVQATPNQASNTPEQNADFIYIDGNRGLGSLRAYELSDSPTHSNVVSVDIYGYLDSLHFGEFRNVSGAGFLDPGIGLDPSPVPEPASALLVLGGMGALTIAGRRRARSR
ncbi:PEP-CTERM sorting domain-containing protein [Roseateles violae]|uniref:PEP-CTERM sorting domain-containing protein n=1 Tax=Roseateles violae TaxID=3058042 RepID=A0ABT8DSI2_9BURK|nr:PEP-CTERM sorting domain-containing protein [Pelomonas sp. PFR6]MDN3921038.1 PEP-CTERM sorting domain-containing protein [Pelomonas sp. PFR6]